MAARTFKTQAKVPISGQPYPSLEVLPLALLMPYPRNARTHSKKQIRQIADSIERFGFTNPVLIDRDEHDPRRPRPGRRRQAPRHGRGALPAPRAMTPAEKRAYVLADNKLALNAGWDEEILAEELKGLLADDLDFDIGLTGFSIPEIDSLDRGLVARGARRRRRTTSCPVTARSGAGRGTCGSSGPIA